MGAIRSDCGSQGGHRQAHAHQVQGDHRLRPAELSQQPSRARLPPLLVPYACCLMGDGGLQEGSSHESCVYSRLLGPGGVVDHVRDERHHHRRPQDARLSKDVARLLRGLQQAVAKTWMRSGVQLRRPRRARTSPRRQGQDDPRLRLARQGRQPLRVAPLGAYEAAATHKQHGWTCKGIEVP